jgi:thymidylate synthase (FAD)
MKIINPSHEIISMPDPSEIMRLIETAGRTCYKSDHKTTSDSAKTFIKGILKSGHESVVEHANISVRFICDRGVSHELVRHRLASYSQESTRYCNYSNEKFGNEITVIRPFFFSQGSIPYAIWLSQMEAAESAYNRMMKNGVKPEEARSILPNSLKTEIVMTANIREWRHVLRLRTSGKAHPQIREIMIPLLKELKEGLPVLFSDIGSEEKG